MKKLPQGKIVEGSGRTITPEYEQELAEMEAHQKRAFAERIPLIEAQNEIDFAQRVEEEEAEWKSRSLWQKLTTPRLRPTR